MLFIKCELVKKTIVANVGAQHPVNELGAFKILPKLTFWRKKLKKGMSTSGSAVLRFTFSKVYFWKDSRFETRMPIDIRITMKIVTFIPRLKFQSHSGCVMN